jgi:hypothetical protein
MPFGTLPQPSATRVFVGTSAPPSVLVGGLQGFGYPGDKAVSEQKFYNTFPSVTSIDAAVRSITLTVRYAKSDSGQDILKANFDLATPTLIYCSILLDGTTGEYLPCIVSHWEPQGPGSVEFAPVNITLVQQGDPVDIAGGF